MVYLLLLLFIENPLMNFEKMPILYPELIATLVPSVFIFFNRKLMMPALPDASYLADGLVIISIASIEVEGSERR